MSYIAFDLDAKKKVPQAARAAGVDPAAIGWGLVELWEHAWLSKSEVVAELVLAGCFGPDQRIQAALVAFGFIEPVEGGFRVKGADRYLRIAKGRSEGGKKAAGNLKRGKQAGDSVPAASRLPSGLIPAPAGDDSRLVPGLSPSTEHRAPNTRKEEDVRELELIPATEATDTAEAVRRLWNEKAPPKLARWKAMTDDRRTAIKARLASHSLAELGAAVERMHRSAFMRGEKPGQTWRPDADWFLKPDTVPKILEGKYDDDPPGVSASPAPAGCTEPGCDGHGTQPWDPDGGRLVCEGCFYQVLWPRWRTEQAQVGGAA